MFYFFNTIIKWEILVKVTCHSAWILPQMDGLVRVNGEMMEDSVVSPSPSALLDSLQEKQENKDVSSKQAEEDNPPEEAVENPKTAEQLTPPPQNEKTAAAATSAISSLIGGRSCTITTTIVTELTQTLVEPLYPEIQSNKKVKTYFFFFFSKTAFLFFCCYWCFILNQDRFNS